ncbi:SIS domain-containing protein [Ohessyouella blattaphilus]|uniref:Glutamine--fructose-6-phosphate aminotransferase [isomerizing] n=1 Tax=Ohessyouella blattaphilus TaxID=2949333 RepID=A0ABT1EL52_9FIRM|nr:SIS domain-containing protein [Ohessyouella blattaphilus]MCP1110401.1 SIS domain-containing protein [Ohessyouella blattaphilus]MCR8563795.1 SIS domain-containing protein [Ohessyouella blattaphilus]
MNVLLQNIYEQPLELKKVLQDLREEKIEEVLLISKLMSEAEEIVLTSMGSAFYSLMPMYEALRAMLNIRVSLVETADLIQHPERMKKEALYIMMSRSGESREVADFSQYLKDNQYTSVAVTMTPNSTMAKNCTYVLHDIASYDAIVCIKAYSSLALCGLFLVSLMGKERPDSALLQKLEHAFTWMETNKKAIFEEIQKIPYFAEADGYYLLSRGYGINMMRSGSLWIEETAKIMSNVMSIDNFYHGPMEVIRFSKQVAQKTIPIFLDVLPDARSQMIWGKINESVSESIYIGAAGKEAVGGVCLNYPEFELPAAYTTLIIALYLQLISYQCAVAKGIEPGTFLDEGWVVL